MSFLAFLGLFYLSAKIAFVVVVCLSVFVSLIRKICFGLLDRQHNNGDANITPHV